MAKINRIKKSRKEQTCGKCRKVIPVGSEYLRASLNFGPTFVRCTSCGLRPWEVTTSDFQLRVGSFQNEWKSNYGTDSDCIENLVNDVQELLDETQEKLDNMPDSLQYGDTGTMLQDRIDALESTISELENIEYEDYVDDEGLLSDEKEEELCEAIDEALCSLDC